MVRHIVTWSFKENLTEEDKKIAGKKFKEDVEGLVGVVDGLIEAKVVVDILPTSTASILLSTLHKNLEALEMYASHPQHILAGVTAKENFIGRQCVDYIE